MKKKGFNREYYLYEHKKQLYFRWYLFDGRIPVKHDESIEGHNVSMLHHDYG